MAGEKKTVQIGNIAGDEVQGVTHIQTLSFVTMLPCRDGRGNSFEGTAQQAVPIVTRGCKRQAERISERNTVVLILTHS